MTISRIHFDTMKPMTVNISLYSVALLLSESPSIWQGSIPPTSKYLYRSPYTTHLQLISTDDAVKELQSSLLFWSQLFHTRIPRPHHFSIVWKIQCTCTSRVLFPLDSFASYQQSRNRSLCPQIKGLSLACWRSISKDSTSSSESKDLQPKAQSLVPRLRSRKPIPSPRLVAKHLHATFTALPAKNLAHGLFLHSQ